MNNAPAILKSLIVYAVCTLLAVWLGYLMTSVAELSSRSSLIYAGIFALVLCIPLLLRWHHVLLALCWNLPLMVFFLQGSPAIWLPMVAISLGISVLQRAVNSDSRFISAPQITWPLIFMTVVVLFTAKLTGGFGLRSFGGEVMGGKRYVFLLGAILGYFALTARRIPPQQAGLYVALFFLAGCANVIGDLVSVVPSALYPIFLFFPPNGYALGGEAQGGFLRLGGTTVMGVAGFSFMLAKYGIRGIFMSGKPWRLFVFALFFVSVFFGGFRSYVFVCVVLFLIQFFLEGLHRTQLLPIFALAGILMAMVCVPLADKLPYTFQRALAFLPLKINPLIRMDAEASTDWRLQMWQAVLPEVPGHLLLGKGYSISQADFQSMSGDFHPISGEDWTAAIAGDYHNGPLSVILAFGIWGVVGFLWFLIAGGRALYNNYRYGDPALQTINTLLFAFFLTRVVFFFLIFGSLYSDMAIFAGVLGLSVSLNGGIRRPAAKPVENKTGPRRPAPMRPRLQPFFQR
jgi:hypothetical protein